MRSMLPLATLLVLQACAESAPPPMPRPWYTGGTLHNATAARWVEADEHNRLASSLDLVTDRLMAMGAPPRQMDPEQLRPWAEQLRDCLTKLAQEQPGSRIGELAPGCIERMNLKWPLPG